MLWNKLTDVRSLEFFCILQSKYSGGRDRAVLPKSLHEDLCAARGVEPEKGGLGGGFGFGRIPNPTPNPSCPHITQMHSARGEIKSVGQSIDCGHSNPEARKATRSDDRNEICKILVGKVLFPQNILDCGNKVGIAVCLQRNASEELLFGTERQRMAVACGIEEEGEHVPIVG